MSRARAAGLLAAFAASLLWVLLTPWCTSDSASAADFVQAARTVSDRATPGALVLVHPPWRDDAVTALREAAVFSPEVVITTALAPRHGEPLPALLILRDAGAPPLPRSLRRQVTQEQRVGAVRIAALAREQGEGALTRDLSDALAFAEVAIERGGERTACAWSPVERRHRCAGFPEWVYVGIRELPVGGRSERCTWAHPITGATLVVRLPRARLLDALTLELALTDGAADNAALASVDAELLIDGAPALTLTRQPGRRGFARTSAPTGGARDAALELRLTTSSDGQRHTCYRLSTEAAP